MKLISYPVIVVNRIIHLVKEPKRIRKLEKTIEVIRREHNKAHDRGMVHYRNVYNVGLYVLILEHDITVLKHDALFSIWEWRKKYVARQLSVLLYEASHDLPALLGKNFRGSLKTLPISEDDLSEFNSITKSLDKFKRNNHVLLNKLRNYAGAHRDNDAEKQLEVIDSISLLQIMELSGNFYEVLRVLLPFLIKLTYMLGNWKVIMKHMPFEGNNT